MCTRKFEPFQLDQQSRTIVRTTREGGKASLSDSRYERYLRRHETVLDSSSKVSPLDTTRTPMSDASWRTWLQTCSFYTWARCVTTRMHRGITVASFRESCPILCAQPHLSLNKPYDPSAIDEYRRELRLCLRTYCNLESCTGRGPRSDSDLAAASVDQLEMWMDEFTGRCSGGATSAFRNCHCPSFVAARWGR